jgi:hypothetical protein
MEEILLRHLPQIGVDSPRHPLLFSPRKQLRIVARAFGWRDGKIQQGNEAFLLDNSGARSGDDIARANKDQVSAKRWKKPPPEIERGGRWRVKGSRFTVYQALANGMRFLFEPPRRFIRPQPHKRCLAQEPVAGPSEIADFCSQYRFDPMNVRARAAIQSESSCFADIGSQMTNDPTRSIKGTLREIRCFPS